MQDRLKTGDKFFRLTILKVFKSGMYWRCECLCDCGKIKIVAERHVREGATQSCGCLQKERVRESETKHGDCYSTEYKSWSGMIQRCNNPRDIKYKNYGGRGIKVCERWRNSYENFLEDVGRKPEKSYSLHRINNDGDYEPNNVKWATPAEQSRYKTTSRYIMLNGISKCITDWCRIKKISRNVFYDRLRRGWSETD